jgi:hypothetical protein
MDAARGALDIRDSRTLRQHVRRYNFIRCIYHSHPAPQVSEAGPSRWAGDVRADQQNPSA